MSRKKWEEKKTSLGNAIIMSAVMAVIGVVIGANWKNWFGGFAPYLGLNNDANYSIDWSELNDIYNKLATTYNGEINNKDVIYPHINQKI